MTSKKIALALVIAAFGLMGLTLSASSSANSKKEVTFNEVAPIFYKNCAECHRPNDIAPMALISYKDARPWARSIKEKVVTREMPPWGPDQKYGEFSNDHRMSQKDIDT